LRAYFESSCQKAEIFDKGGEDKLLWRSGKRHCPQDKMDDLEARYEVDEEGMIARCL